MSKQMQIASRQLLAIMSNHLLVCSFILFAQVGLRLISPLVSILLMHVTLVRMAECTWSLQAKTMPGSPASTQNAYYANSTWN